MSKPITRLAAMLAALMSAATLCAQMPQIINYQGRVAVNGVNFDGAGTPGRTMVLYQRP